MAHTSISEGQQKKETAEKNIASLYNKDSSFKEIIDKLFSKKNIIVELSRYSNFQHLGSRIAEYAVTVEFSKSREFVFTSESLDCNPDSMPTFPSIDTMDKEVQEKIIRFFERFKDEEETKQFFMERFSS